jgi:cytosine/adenosine deaminase-related metal-dependent hydrolase
VTERETFRAKWLLSDPWTVIENGYVTVEGGTIESVGSGRPPDDAPVTDLGAGAMIPRLVNAHTHLELSALAGALPFDSGFLRWTSELVQKRADMTETELLFAAAKAVRNLIRTGCGALADISTLGITGALLQESGMGGIVFREHLGAERPENPELKASDPLSCSLAAHAPHTTAPELIRGIRQATSGLGLPMSIHLAESAEEAMFIQTARGDWADFLSERGIDFSEWGLPARSPVAYMERLKVLDSGTLAVHLLHCSGEDMQILREHGAAICFCPRSNLLLHGKLPDIPAFLDLGLRPCLGTDSLASCPSLSILDEMAFVFANYDLSPADIFAMGTVYGASALGIGNRFGRLAPGFASPPFYVDIDAASSRDVLRAVVCSGNADTEDIHRKSET